MSFHVPTSATEAHKTHLTFDDIYTNCLATKCGVQITGTNVVHRLQNRDSVASGLLPYLVVPVVASRSRRLSASVFILLWLVSIATSDGVTSDQRGSSSNQLLVTLVKASTFQSTVNDYSSDVVLSHSDIGATVSPSLTERPSVIDVITISKTVHLVPLDSARSQSMVYPSVLANVSGRGTLIDTDSVNVDSADFLSPVVATSNMTDFAVSWSTMSRDRSVSPTASATSIPHHANSVSRSSISTLATELMFDSVVDVSQTITGSDSVTRSQQVNGESSDTEPSSFYGAITQTTVSLPDVTSTLTIQLHDSRSTAAVVVTDVPSSTLPDSAIMVASSVLYVFTTSIAVPTLSGKTTFLHPGMTRRGSVEGIDSTFAAHSIIVSTGTIVDTSSVINDGGGQILASSTSGMSPSAIGSHSTTSSYSLLKHLPAVQSSHMLQSTVMQPEWQGSSLWDDSYTSLEGATSPTPSLYSHFATLNTYTSTVTEHEGISTSVDTATDTTALRHFQSALNVTAGSIYATTTLDSQYSGVATELHPTDQETSLATLASHTKSHTNSVSYRDSSFIQSKTESETALKTTFHIPSPPPFVLPSGVSDIFEDEMLSKSNTAILSTSTATTDGNTPSLTTYTTRKSSPEATPHNSFNEGAISSTATVELDSRAENVLTDIYTVFQTVSMATSDDAGAPTIGPPVATSQEKDATSHLDSVTSSAEMSPPHIGHIPPTKTISPTAVASASTSTLMSSYLLTSNDPQMPDSNVDSFYGKYVMSTIPQIPPSGSPYITPELPKRTRTVVDSSVISTGVVSQQSTLASTTPHEATLSDNMTPTELVSNEQPVTTIAPMTTQEMDSSVKTTMKETPISTAAQTRTVIVLPKLEQHTTTRSHDNNNTRQQQHTTTRSPTNQQETTQSPEPMTSEVTTTTTRHVTSTELRSTPKSTTIRDVIYTTNTISFVRHTTAKPTASRPMADNLTAICTATSSTLATGLSPDLATKVLRNLLLVTVKPVFGQDINDGQYRKYVQRGLLRSYLIGQTREILGDRRKRATQLDVLPPNPFNAIVTMTSTEAARDDVVQLTFYVRHGISAVVSAEKVTQVYSRLQPVELAAYIGAQVLTMPAPLSAVVAAAADGKSPSSSSSSSVNWWVVVIIVLLLLAVLVAVLLIVVWYKRVRRSGSIGVPTPVHGSQPYTRGLRQTYNVNFDLEKGALTEQPCRSTREDISPLDDIVLVTSEQRESRTKSRSDKRGLYHKVFQAHDTEPKLVGFRNTAYELAEVTPLRKEYFAPNFTQQRAYDSSVQAVQSHSQLVSSNTTHETEKVKHKCHLVEEDYDSMSMSSLSDESDQPEAGLFEYVVKMSHTDGRSTQSTPSHGLPIHFRTSANPLENDVPDVNLRPVIYPQTEPEQPVGQDSDPVPSGAPSEPSCDGPTTVRETEESQSEEPNRHHSHRVGTLVMRRKTTNKRKTKKDKKRERDNKSNKGRGKNKHPSSDVDGNVGRNMRAAPMQPPRTQSDSGDTTARREEQFHRQNWLLQERLCLARQRQQQQLQLQVVVQEMLNETYMKHEHCVKVRRHHDAKQVQKLLDGSFPLAGTTIVARECCINQASNSETQDAPAQET
ncbi:hypothetical protein LSAT2_002057 [Lamellibrachia satsuma]|nr:hypothetical protein LSAT2_002057 [Lamellibrachia satsuma]